MNNVRLLMRKELLYLFRGLKSNLIVVLVFTTILTMLSSNMALPGVIIVPYFLIYAVMAQEEKNNAHILSVTLPVNRKEICLSKYILGIVYTFIGSLLITLSLFIPANRGDGFAQLLINIGVGKVVSMFMTIGLIYIAIMIPLIYKFGSLKMRYYMFLLYIILFGGFSAISSIMKELGVIGSVNGSQSTYKGAPYVLALCISLLIYVLSYQLATKIHEHREFK